MSTITKIIHTLASLSFAMTLAARAQNHAHAGANGTVHIVTNGGVTIITSVVTNGGSFTYSSSSVSGTGGTFQQSSGAMPPDMQKLLRQFTSGTRSFTAASPNSSGDTNPVTWLGVAADEASDDLRAQLPLPDASGLVIRDITAGSPAASAGLQPNDILYKLDDQILVNSPQLQSLIRGRKAGDEVTLTFLRKGKETKAKTKLASRAPSEDGPEAQQVINLGNFDLDLNKVFGQLNGGTAPVVIHKSFSSTGTNLVGGANADDLQKTVQEAVERAMQQMKKQMESQGATK